MSTSFPEFTAAQAAESIRVPTTNDNKYSHGVVGFVTGSTKYPGAAVLGVEAAQRAGIGMVRYLGPAEPAALVLARRPETVTVAGNVDAWIIGSGMETISFLESSPAALSQALRGSKPVVIDAGALSLVTDATAPVIITPHEGELERLIPRGADSRENWVIRAADQFGAVVVLKGHITLIASPQDGSDHRFTAQITASTTWLATAGTGDVLAGAIGVIVATHSVDQVPTLDDLARYAATGVYLHSRAGSIAAIGGPFPALDVAKNLSTAVAELASGIPG